MSLHASPLAKILIFCGGLIAIGLLILSIGIFEIFAYIGATSILTNQGTIPSSVIVVNPIPDISAVKVLVTLGQSFVALLFNVSCVYALCFIAVCTVAFTGWVFGDEIVDGMYYLSNLRIVNKKDEEKDL